MFLRSRVNDVESAICNHGYKLDALNARCERLEVTNRALNDRLDTYRVLFEKLSDYLKVNLEYVTPGWRVVAKGVPEDSNGS